MASLNTLFLGIYTSNGIVRVLFLPLCYILLLSPFLALLGYYLGFGQVLKSLVSDEFSWVDLLPQFVLSAVFLVLPTRLLSGLQGAGSSKDVKNKRVQALPYWVPGLRNLISIVFGGERWLQGIQQSSINSITSYRIVGAKHNIILMDTSNESLLSQILQNRTYLQEPRDSRSAILHNAFRLPKQVASQFFECEQVIRKTINSEIFAERSMYDLITATLHNLSETLPDFVTYNSSIVDQMQWERVADIELTDGTSEAECNLLALMNDFCCNAILSPIVGTQFTESYQLLASDLAAFNQRYWALSLGLPRLSPINGLPGAALAQKRLLQNLTRLFQDLTSPTPRRVPDDDESISGEEETDADVATPISELNVLFVEQNLPMNARASITLQLIHRIVAEVVPLAFWTLVQVFASSSERGQDMTHLHRIKEQTKTWAQAIQPPSIHPSFPAPPEISFGSPTTAASSNSFPELRACVTEARRLYNSSIDTFQVVEPFIVREAGVGTNEQITWELERGSYVDIGLSQRLLNTSPTLFPDPKTFNPDRFGDSSLAVPSIKTNIDDVEPYVTTLIISIVVGIIQLWELAPAPKKTFFEHMQEAREEAQSGAAALSRDASAARSSQVREKKVKEGKGTKWLLPNAVDGASVKVPSRDIRVRVRRREGLPQRRVEPAR